MACGHSSWMERPGSIIEIHTYELTMNITTNSDGTADRLNVGLRDEDLARLYACISI